MNRKGTKFAVVGLLALATMSVTACGTAASHPAQNGGSTSSSQAQPHDPFSLAPTNSSSTTSSQSSKKVTLSAQDKQYVANLLSATSQVESTSKGLPAQLTKAMGSGDLSLASNDVKNAISSVQSVQTKVDAQKPRSQTVVTLKNQFDYSVQQYIQGMKSISSGLSNNMGTEVQSGLQQLQQQNQAADAFKATLTADSK